MGPHIPASGLEDRGWFFFDLTALRNIPAESRVNIGARTYVAHCDADETGIQVSYDGKKVVGTVQSGSLYAGDSSKPDPKPNRAELSGHLLPFAVASTVWNAFSFAVDTDLLYAFIMQFHQREEVGDAAANPMFEMQVVGRTLSMVTRHSNVSPLPDDYDWNANTRWTKPAPLVLGQVHNVVLSLKHGPSGNGRLGAWFDGVQVHNPATDIPFGFASSLFNYDKFCIYDGNDTTTRSVRFFNWEIGTADLSDRILNPLPL